MIASGAEVSAARLYNLIATLPAMDRKVVFRGLSADMKAAVWREHLDNFTATHELSAAQAQLIGAAQNFLTVDVFATPKTDPDWEAQVHVPLKMLEDSARNVFDPDLLAEAFGQLGPEDSSASSASTSTATGLRRSGPIALLVSECTCSDVSDMCVNATCGGGICYRSEGDYGCGFMWNYECDSMCRRAQ
jgi:hypothetical protein